MTVQEEVLKSMQEMAAQFAQLGVDLKLPPNSTTVLRTEYVAIDYGKMLTVRIPFRDEFTNPLHIFQGGFICAAFDEAYGPLTYMAAGKPVLTIEMSTSFIRPFTAKDEYIEIKAEVVSQTKTLMVLKAEARSKEGKLIASSTTHSLVAAENKLQVKQS